MPEGDAAWRRDGCWSCSEATPARSKAEPKQRFELAHSRTVAPSQLCSAQPSLPSSMGVCPEILTPCLFATHFPTGYRTREMLQRHYSFHLQTAPIFHGKTRLGEKWIDGNTKKFWGPLFLRSSCLQCLFFFFFFFSSFVAAFYFTSLVLTHLFQLNHWWERSNPDSLEYVKKQCVTLSGRKSLHIHLAFFQNRCS